MSHPEQMTDQERIEGMKAWATSQIGKLTGPIPVRPGETITDPDKFINSQLFIMEHSKLRSRQFTNAYMQLYDLKRHLADK